MKDKLEVDIRVPNQTRYLSLIGRIGEDIARTLSRYSGDREELAYHINLVLTEAMANAIRHANEDDPSKEVHIAINLVDRILNIKVFDQGQGFDISTLSEPDYEQLTDHGRGIYIIRTLMDEVTYVPCDGGNVLEMSKRLK